MQRPNGTPKIVQVTPGTVGITAIYPNPSSQQLTIEYMLNPCSKKAEITLLDIMGKTVCSQSLPLLPVGNKITLQTITLVPGIYYCRATADGKMLSVAKVVIAR